MTDRIGRRQHAQLMAALHAGGGAISE